jgi:hypothetical protein
MPYTGFKFSWYNVQHEGDAIMKKLDWIFGNPSLFSSLLHAHSKFLPRDYLDNSIMVILPCLFLHFKNVFKKNYFFLYFKLIFFLVFSDHFDMLKLKMIF